jgi:hypothetical protein
MLTAADQVLGDNDTLCTSTTPGETEGFPDRRQFTAWANQKVRVVLTWRHKSPLGDALTEPMTDLDLTVVIKLDFGASEVLIFQGASASYDNNCEIVEFTAPATGMYLATFDSSRPSAAEELIGLAVSRTDR